MHMLDGATMRSYCLTNPDRINPKRTSASHYNRRARRSFAHPEIYGPEAELLLTSTHAFNAARESLLQRNIRELSCL